MERRGLLRPGCCADLVVFDPRTIANRATRTDPHRFPTSEEYVIVNGALAIERGEHASRLSGRILRKKA